MDRQQYAPPPPPPPPPPTNTVCRGYNDDQWTRRLHVIDEGLVVSVKAMINGDRRVSISEFEIEEE